MKKIILVIGLVSSLFAGEPSDEITKLSSSLRSLLSQEMVAVEKSMKNIFTNIISADYENLKKEATGIQNSFILKKKLSKEQKHELHSKVSKEFIAMDKNFHEIAGKLANAAEFEDKKEVNKYFFQMTNTCVKCHSTFATFKFTNFE